MDIVGFSTIRILIGAIFLQSIDHWSITQIETTPKKKQSKIKGQVRQTFYQFFFLFDDVLHMILFFRISINNF